MGAASGTKLQDNYGLVLVDEVDLHIHPEWQRSVTASLSEALPNLQFVFTSHSPIVAGSLHKENIYVMETESSGESVVRQYQERIYGLDAEQVLLSSYFGLRTTRAETFVDELRELSIKAGKGDVVAAFDFMQKLSEDTTSSSDSPSSDNIKKVKQEKPHSFAELWVKFLSAQTILQVVAVTLLSIWLVGEATGQNIDGFVYAPLGAALAIIVELILKWWKTARKSNDKVKKEK